MLYTILIVVLVLLLLGLLPVYPYSTNWGYYPSGFVVLLLVIVLLIIFFGRPV